MKIKCVFLSTILTAVLCFRGSLLAYSGGDGTAGNPYQVADVADFNQLSTTPTDWNKSFVLTANINLTDLTFTKAPIAPDTNSVTSGFQGTRFTGIFDGNSYVISNLTITAWAQDFIGLFGSVYRGQIRNFGIKNINVTGRGNIGGMVGEFSGVLTSCYSTGTINGLFNGIGGLVGNSYYSSSSRIENCYSTGSVNGSFNSSGVGGLVGWNNVPVSNCYSTCAVSGSLYGGYVGGLVGTTGDWGFISRCHSTGLVSGGSAAGGLVGGSDFAPPKGMVSSSFWDVNTSGQISSRGGEGKTTTEMMMLSTFTSAGWDFSVFDGNPAVWMILRPGEDYPRLAWQEIFTGDIAGLYGVNFVDYAEIAAHWGQTGCPTGCENADINNDGTVDIDDLMLLADNWLAGL